MSNVFTLPLEFELSRLAKLVLTKMGFIKRGPESEAGRQVLNAAVWTYLAAFIFSMIHFLRQLLPLLSGRER